MNFNKRKIDGAKVTKGVWYNFFKGKKFMVVIVNEEGIPVAYAPLKDVNKPKVIVGDDDEIRISFDIIINPV